MKAVIRHGHGLGKALGLVVNPPGTDRVHIAPIVFFLRVNEGIPIAFAGRGKKKACSLGLGQPESVVGTQRAHLEGLDRQLKVVDRAGWRGEVKDEIYRAFDRNELRDIVTEETKTLFGSKVVQVSFIARQQIVDGHHLVSFLQETIGQMGPQKSCSTRNHAGWHHPSPRFIPTKSKP